MADRYHSRVFAAITQIAADLDVATWPPHPTTGRAPVVGVGDSRNPKPNETEADEFVDVIYRVEDDASITWARIQGRDETFLVDVYVRSSVLGQDRAKAWDRLSELAEIPQGMYYVIPPTGPAVFAPPVFPGVAKLGGVERVTPAMWTTDQGWFGECIITFRISARI